MEKWRWGMFFHAAKIRKNAGRGKGKTFTSRYDLSGRCDSCTPPSTYLQTVQLVFPQGFTPRQTTNFFLPQSKSPPRAPYAKNGRTVPSIKRDLRAVITPNTLGSTSPQGFATRRQTAAGCHNTIEPKPHNGIRTSAWGDWIVGYSEMFQYKQPYPVKATCITDPVAQPTVQPYEPPLNVLSESMAIIFLTHNSTRLVNADCTVAYIQQLKLNPLLHDNNRWLPGSLLSDQCNLQPLLFCSVSMSKQKSNKILFVDLIVDPISK